MSTYAIGDIQGCYDELRQLLHLIKFNPEHDQLLFAGDLVNRGPHSLEVLRYIKALGNRAKTVLGNHDLHLLALSQNNRSHAQGQSLDAILNAPDKDELLDWLRHRPLLIHEKKFNLTLIHAGLPPQWNLSQAKAYAQEVESILRSDDQFPQFFSQMYGNEPKQWHDNLEGMDRLRFITNCFTRLRFCDEEGVLGLKEKGKPGTQNAQFSPWFEVQTRKTQNDLILFGHWSTLGLLHRHNIWSLDTGCLWGGRLTALRIEDMKPFQVDCQASQNPTHF